MSAREVIAGSMEDHGQGEGVVREIIRTWDVVFAMRDSRRVSLCVVSYRLREKCVGDPV